MAHIVQFRAATMRGVPEAEAGPQGSAEIIIFPGVRRERHAEADPHGGADETRPARDHLELLELPELRQ